MERRHLTFRGRVQGVGFRATARAVASGFEITGWVRNEPDGSVALEAQGDPAELERYLAALRERMSRLITAEDTRPASLAEGERDFEIHH